jgi:hypothetical protein
VGVAALLITQIFKKPLSGVGGSYYTITGSWDDPVIESVERSDLDLTAFSECEEQLPELSPEEIGAMEELLRSRESVIELPGGMFDTDKSPLQEDQADSPETKDVDELHND